MSSKSALHAIEILDLGAAAVWRCTQAQATAPWDYVLEAVLVKLIVHLRRDPRGAVLMMADGGIASQTGQWQFGVGLSCHEPPVLWCSTVQEVSGNNIAGGMVTVPRRLFLEPNKLNISGSWGRAMERGHLAQPPCCTLLSSFSLLIYKCNFAWSPTFPNAVIPPAPWSGPSQSAADAALMLWSETAMSGNHDN
ncbi:hypothetical protein BX600DRAFT_432739 [Xylariales sp. PMI_506]|nr:hypothetical protein BX600DRAFT_432739 [Xylariales sp. PMI_506]